MSDITYVTPVVGEDSIELYVTNDGKETGISISGLARLTGIKRQTISELVNNLHDPAGNSYPKSLESLQGNVFNPQVEGSNGAKIIMEDVAIRIVEYYAYESRMKSEIAKTNFRILAAKGLNAYIKESVEEISKQDQPTLADIHSTIINLITKIDNYEQEVKETRPILIEHRKIKNVTSVVIPGVGRMLDDYLKIETDRLLLASGNKATLKLWIQKEKGCVLNKNQMHKFAHLVSGAYKSATGKEPVKSRVVKSIDKTTGRKKYQNNTCVYSEEEFPILEMAWNKLMCS